MDVRAFLRRFTYGVLVVLPGQFLEIPAAIVGICTLGFYVPSWAMVWYCKAFIWYIPFEKKLGLDLKPKATEVWKGGFRVS